jgi:hypothetical protein
MKPTPRLPVFALSILLVGLATLAAAPHGSQMDPLNASYRIEDRKIPLLDGRHEVEAAPARRCTADPRVLSVNVLDQRPRVSGILAKGISHIEPKSPE